MGINVHIQTVDDQDHPDWDWIRHAGDRDVPTIIEENGGTIAYPEKPEWGDDWRLFRPKDFAALRAAKWPDCNEARWVQLVDILEGDGKWWLHYSY